MAEITVEDEGRRIYDTALKIYLNYLSLVKRNIDGKENTQIAKDSIKMAFGFRQYFIKEWFEFIKDD